MKSCMLHSSAGSRTAVCRHRRSAATVIQSSTRPVRCRGFQLEYPTGSSCTNDIKNSQAWNDELAQRYDLFLPVTSLYSKSALRVLLDKAGISEQQAGTCKLDVLDVACGTGSFAHVAAEALPNCHIHGIDFSQDMLNLFQAKTAYMGLTNRVTGEVLDGQNMHTIPDDVFDFVGCVFGLMLFPNRSRGWSEIHRVLKPGSCGSVVGWVDSDVIEIMRQISLDLAPECHPHHSILMSVSLGDPAQVLPQIRAAAPFKDIQTVQETAEFQLPKAGVADFVKGAIAMRLGADNVASMDEEHVMDSIHRAVNKFASDEGMCRLKFHGVTYIVEK